MSAVKMIRLVWPPAEILKLEESPETSRYIFTGYDARWWVSLPASAFMTDDAAVELLSPIARDYLLKTYAAEARRGH